MIVARAPLRVPLGGGGTDLPGYASRFGGFVLSAAINKYVYINVNRPHVDDVIRVKYSRTEEVDDLEQIVHPLVREALRLTGIRGGIEISAMADVPAGTGLGSSGSFLVALLTALHGFKREHPSTYELAEEACHIEIDRAGQPAGKQDQYLAAFGGITCLDIARDGRVRVSPLRIAPGTFAEMRNFTLLFYTGLRRESFDILAEQGRGAQADEAAVVENMHRIKEIGLRVKAALESDDLEQFGLLLDEHWRAKRGISSKMSSSTIDRWYQLGLQNGALGGKLMGAGGGGFLMFFCPSENGGKTKLRRAMAAEGLREMPFDFDEEGAKVLMNF